MGEACIKSMEIVVESIHLVNNYLPMGEFRILPKIQKRIATNLENENAFKLDMVVELKNTEENPFPIDLKVEISGIFELEGGDLSEKMEFLNNQGVKMVYPYLRSLVSSITANSNIPPITLPIINVQNFIDR